MSHLQIWLQNHNRRLSQEAIDEALMEYISHIENQRDGLLEALEKVIDASISPKACRIAQDAIASVKGGAA